MPDLHNNPPELLNQRRLYRTFTNPNRVCTSIVKKPFYYSVKTLSFSSWLDHLKNSNFHNFMLDLYNNPDKFLNQRCLYPTLLLYKTIFFYISYLLTYLLIFLTHLKLETNFVYNKVLPIKYKNQTKLCYLRTVYHAHRDP